MLRRLLLQNLSLSQIIGYALATLIGLSIVGCAVKFYADAVSVFAPSADESAAFSDSYPVISKPVTMLGTLGSASTFAPAEIAEIRSQPWAGDVAPFLPANFTVVATVDFAGRGFSTHMFLEAIPDDFIDVRPEGWDYTPGSGDCLPVIIPKDYLNLYNFGFAASRGLPQVTPAMLSQVPLNLSLSGPSGGMTICARIAGFSSRINTIAVPMSFMTYANSLLAPGTSTAPSRLIIRVSDPTDPAIARYLDSRGYEISGTDPGASRAASLLRLGAGIIITIGLIISALALMILLLSINLLIQKNRPAISTLIFLGYTPGTLARRYIAATATLNAILTLGAILITLSASALWKGALAPFGLAPASALGAIGVMVALMLILTAINAITIKNRVGSEG